MIGIRRIKKIGRKEIKKIENVETVRIERGETKRIETVKTEKEESVKNAKTVKSVISVKIKWISLAPKEKMKTSRRNKLSFRITVTEPTIS